MSQQQSPAEPNTSAWISKKDIIGNCKWMLELGFNVVRKKEGTYVYGHEHEDVVKYCKKFLRPLQEVADKTITLFHDESIFQSNEHQRKG